jgi:hypothetical protein
MVSFHQVPMYYTSNFFSCWNKNFHSDYSVGIFFCSNNFLGTGLLTLEKQLRNELEIPPALVKEI